MENETQVYPKLFTWLFVGLLITFISGYALSLNESLYFTVLTIGMFPIIIIELLVAIFFGFRIQKMKPGTAKICYILFCIVTGITFGTIFMEYQMTSIIMIFAVTSLIFGLLAVYGYTTKKDLSRIGTILFFGLLGTIIMILINIFLKSDTMSLVISAVSVLVFTGYIAYDMQKVKVLLPTLGEEKTAIYGAFQLYLDFINLFIRLLRLFGKRDD